MKLTGRMALCDGDIEILLEVASLCKTYVEIGTLYGGSAILAGKSGCEVFCIDPLDGFYSAKHGEPGRPDKATGLVPSEEIVRKNWEDSGLDPNKLHIFPQLHPPWPDEIDRTFDAGFIDGDHRLLGVLADYEGMAPRVKYLMFHDINKVRVMAVYNMALASGDWEVYVPKISRPNIVGILKRREA